MRGEDGEARETRLCFKAVAPADDAAATGNGVLNENVEDDGTALACDGSFAGLLLDETIVGVYLNNQKC